MPSVWVEKAFTSSGKTRWRVRYRLGGRGTRPIYAGQFKLKRDANERAAWVSGELAAMRVPDPGFRSAKPPKAPTFATAAERFRAARLDISEGTKVQQRTSLNRAVRVLGAQRVDELTPQDIAGMVAELHAEGLKPSYIRKILQATAMVLDHAGMKPNPARDKTIVKLPREEPDEVNPPTVDQIMAVFHLLPSKHRLALLWLDWSGARVASVDLTLVGDYDERSRRVRLRARTTKTRRALWVELPDPLADALEATLPPREDRDPQARLFASSGADALRTSIAKACRAAGVPSFSPHDLRHRRISLLHLRGVPWARIGEMVGQRNLAVTANTYSHVMLDETEVDYGRLLPEAGLGGPPL